jgi:hypothetical protein
MLVALTGWGQEEDRRRSAEAGFDAHLIKSVDFSALAELLAQAEANDAQRDTSNDDRNVRDPCSLRSNLPHLLIHILRVCGL